MVTLISDDDKESCASCGIPDTDKPVHTTDRMSFVTSTLKHLNYATHFAFDLSKYIFSDLNILYNSFSDSQVIKLAYLVSIPKSKTEKDGRVLYFLCLFVLMLNVFNSGYQRWDFSESSDCRTVEN